MLELSKVNCIHYALQLAVIVSKILKYKLELTYLNCYCRSIAAKPTGTQKEKDITRLPEN